MWAVGVLPPHDGDVPRPLIEFAGLPFTIKMDSP
jgi:hypothetical protein